MNQAALKQNQELHDAFATFNEMSQQLATSYHDLEQRVVSLNAELAVAHSDRLQELTEKERVASRLQSLLCALPAGVVVLDGQGKVQETNPAAIDLLGEPLIGEVWLNIINRAFSPRVDDGHDISLCDGRRVSLSTQSLGDEPGQIILLQDVTETRAMQERLSRHKRLSDMGEMAASLAHQIRTPLASALLYTSHLAGNELAEENRIRFANKIRSSLHHLEAQVNDMLMFASGSNAGDDKISITDLLAKIEQSMEAQLHNANALLSINDMSAQSSIAGNYDALLSAIQNLVNNALEVCTGACELKLNAKLTFNSGVQGVVISLQDNGPGIEQDMLEQIFEPFFTTRSRGTGLGLAVVKAVVHAHSGTIWAESAPGHGSIFNIYLPLEQQTSLSSGGNKNGKV